MLLTKDYPHSVRMLLAAVFFFLISLAIGTIYLQTPVLIITALFLIGILIFLKPLLGLAIIIAAAFLLNINFKVDSPYRKANEIVLFAIIPIFLLYINLFPKIVNGIRVSSNYVKNITLLLFFFFCWAAISLSWTHDLYHGINTLVTLMIGVIMVAAFLVLVKDKAGLFKVLNIFPFIGIALGIVLLISKWHSGVKDIDIFRGVKLFFALIVDEKRPGGFASPNIASAIMNIFIFINIVLMYRGRLFKRIALGLVTVFFMLCSFLTASKAGIASLVIGLFLLVFIMPHFRGFRVRMTFAFLSLMLLVLVIAGEFIIKRFQLLIERGMSVTGDRLDWWETGFNKLFDTYGIGLGIGGFLRYIDPVPGVHSFYFSMLFDLGVVGFLLFMIIIAVLIDGIRKIFKTCTDREMIFIICCFIASVVTFGIQALFNEDFQSMHFWLLLSLIFTAVNISGRNEGSLREDIRLVKGYSVNTH